jgi:chlorite dismutase
MADQLTVMEGDSGPMIQGGVWTLRGTTSNTRYTNRAEVAALTAAQQGLRRSKATQAALIPIRKTPAWWALAQDERRAIFEEQSRHIAIGMEYLPPIARRLHHCRELGEPFDFLTWFEYAPEHSDAFEEMVDRLRHTQEWDYIDREVDIRLSRIDPK